MQIRRESKFSSIRAEQTPQPQILAKRAASCLLIKDYF
jgi:hypothetical protein